MNSDVDVLIETYQTLKQYIPSKDRQEASDTLMSYLVDVLSDEQLIEFKTTDSYTKRSYDEYAGEIDTDSFDDNDDYDS
jgi:hypothetical protein